MRHQGEHFDLISRGNFWGFRGVNISSKGNAMIFREKNSNNKMH